MHIGLPPCLQLLSFQLPEAGFNWGWYPAGFPAPLTVATACTSCRHVELHLYGPPQLAQIARVLRGTATVNISKSRH